MVGVADAPALGVRYHATRDGGAWCGTRPLVVSGVLSLVDALVAHSPVEEWFRSGDGGHLADLAAAARGTRGLSDAWAHLLVAQGSVDALVEHEACYAWDWSATQVIVEEAGGRITTLDGGSRRRARTCWSRTGWCTTRSSRSSRKGARDAQPDPHRPRAGDRCDVRRHDRRSRGRTDRHPGRLEHGRHNPARGGDRRPRHRQRLRGQRRERLHGRDLRVRHAAQVLLDGPDRRALPRDRLRPQHRLHGVDVPPSRRVEVERRPAAHVGGRRLHLPVRDRQRHPAVQELLPERSDVRDPGPDDADLEGEGAHVRAVDAPVGLHRARARLGAV